MLVVRGIIIRGGDIQQIIQTQAFPVIQLGASVYGYRVRAYDDSSSFSGYSSAAYATTSACAPTPAPVVTISANPSTTYLPVALPQFLGQQPTIRLIVVLTELEVLQQLAIKLFILQQQQLIPSLAQELEELVQVKLRLMFNLPLL